MLDIKECLLQYDFGWLKNVIYYLVMKQLRFFSICSVLQSYYAKQLATRNFLYIFILNYLILKTNYIAYIYSFDFIYNVFSRLKRQ